MKYFGAFFIFIILESACNTSITKEELTSKENNLISENIPKKDTPQLEWTAPDTLTIPDDEFGAAVIYGRKLILNTAYYIGPEGIVSKNLGNKMNCTNCHLDAGTRLYGFNFSSTHARYPQYRARENKTLSLSERVNNCIERPHNGKPLPLDSKEMTAIICYIKWLGQGVPVNQHVVGDSPIKIEFPERAADVEKGKLVYMRDCQSCHGENGEGKMKTNNNCYEYPPLWGLKSYKPGSSMHRLVKAATFIYCNMPFNRASYNNPILTIEESFDVAAFINDDQIHVRPHDNDLTSYPNKETKPLDYGQGPYIDSFPESQHKFGPYQPIIDWRKSKGLPAKF
jgi:thiosulfate dehydrogenase